MRTRIPGIMGVMFLLGGTLLVATTPAAAEGSGEDPIVEQRAIEQPVVDDPLIEEPVADQAGKAPAVADGGQKTDGDQTDGGQTDGATDGDQTDGGQTDGDQTDGGQTDGDQTDGGQTDGATDSSQTDSSQTDSSQTEGDQTDGATDSSQTDGGQEEDPADQVLAICHFDDGDPFDSWRAVTIPGQEVDAWLAQYPEDFKIAHAECPVSDDVTICVPQGLNWKAQSVHPDDANWMLANEGATLPGEDGGCLIRVCYLQEGEFFDVWRTLYGSLAEAEAWTEQALQSSWPEHDKPCPTNPTVTICHLLGLDYESAEVDTSEAEWLLSLDGDDRLAGEDGCPLRVCHAEGEPYVEWQVLYLDTPAAHELASSRELDFLADKGQTCPRSEPVALCVPNAAGYELSTVDPLTANELVGAQAGVIEPTEGSCPQPEPTPTPEPEPTPTPEPEQTPTPEPEESPTPEPEPTPDPGEETDASAPTPPTPEPKVDEPADQGAEDETAETPRQENADSNSDAEVLGRSQRRALAETGTESTQLAIYGIALVVGGAMLVGISRLRRPTN